jgi:hypothetical protein
MGGLESVCGGEEDGKWVLGVAGVVRRAESTPRNPCSVICPRDGVRT